MCKQLVYTDIGTFADAFKTNLKQTADRIINCLFKCFKQIFIKWALISYHQYPEDFLLFISENSFTDSILKFREVAASNGLRAGNATVKTVFFAFFKNKLRENLQKENRFAEKQQRLNVLHEAVLENNEKAFEKEMLYRSMELSLQKMGTGDRQIITWRHLEEKSNVEIAELLGISTPAATNRIYRCMQRLRNLTEKHIQSNEYQY